MENPDLENVEFKKEIDKIFQTVFKGCDVAECKNNFFKETNFTYENINSSIKGAIENDFTLRYQLDNLIRIFKRINTTT